MSSIRSDRGALAPATLLPPTGMKATRVEVGGEEFVVLEWDVPRARVSGLSQAETQVACLLLEGRSNAAIAATRRASVGTITKQVARVFRKLGVCSRSELYAAAAHAPHPPEGHERCS